ASTLVRLIRSGTEPHVFFYGFSLPGEDTVNPQLLPARILLPLGWPTFSSRIRFFDHERFLYFPWPIRPLTDVQATLASLPVPFYGHAAKEHSLPSITARYLNGSQVTPVDLGLTNFSSVRVDRYGPAGPMPIPQQAVEGPPAPSEDGLCLTLTKDFYPE